MEAAELRSPTLNCWKEISSFFDRGIRTVQRWEAHEQLPIHRIGTGSRSPVFAYEWELNQWLRKRAYVLPESMVENPAQAKSPGTMDDARSPKFGNTHALIARNRSDSATLHERLRKQQHLLRRMSVLSDAMFALMEHLRGTSSRLRANKTEIGETAFAQS